jgi:hypothetical protein
VAVPTKQKCISKKDVDKLHLVEAVECTAMQTKDFTQKLPKPVVIEAFVNGRSVKTLLDGGSLANFMSMTLADQLGVKEEALAKPLPLQLAVHRLRSKINFSLTDDFQYQDIAGARCFDIVNLDGYNLILGTLLIFQHKVLLGLNPTRVLIRVEKPEQIEGKLVATILSVAAEVFEDELEKVRSDLKREAWDLCLDTEKAKLPPMRTVNHAIHLIDENKVSSWRPSCCPKALRPVWQEKKNAYLANGHWVISTGSNGSPMLILSKLPKLDGKACICTVVDKCEQNTNTWKLTAPLPDIDAILRNVVRHPYRSLIDGKDTYEQIRVIPEHVNHTLFTTPDGMMESLTLQQGDCNGPSTYQTLMNHLFAPYIGVFMDVYLDDIVIYSDTIEDYVEHIQIVFDVLWHEKLYLSADKMDFFAERLHISQSCN